MSDGLDLLELAEKSAANDLAFLIRAKEESKRRMKENPTPDNISAFNRARAAVEDETRRLQGGSAAMRIFKTQLDAVDFLRDSGFKSSKSQFNRDVAARKVSKAEAGFEEGALLAYAAANLTPLTQHENKALSNATVDRISADTELKRYTAERTRLKLEKEMGMLMPRTEHEEALSARALFFKSEIESFGYRKAGEIIALVDGDDSKLEALLEWWNRETADWMDAWDSDREFTYGEEDPESTPSVESGDE